MNVSLTKDLEALVDEKVQSGMYHSASEVVREGLRLLKERDELRQVRLDELRREIAIGIEQADRGRTKAFDVDGLKRRLRDRVRPSRPARKTA
jgi:antitoxin ParD1/3/4